MGSRQHLSGVGFSPRLIGRRTLASLLAGEQQRTADNRPAVYVRALGRGIHLFKDLCSEQTYRVTGPPDYTFRPGTVLPIGSFNGLQGEWISGFPAMGQAGGSELPVSLSVRSTGLRVKGPCPSVPLGRSYLGVYRESASPDRLHAFLYVDGTYQSDLGYVELSEISVELEPMQRIHPFGNLDVVILQGTKDAEDCLVTWDIQAGTLKAAEPHLGTGDLGGPIWPGSGSDMYFADIAYFGGAQHVQLYRVPIGLEGDIDLGSSAVGAEYIEGTGDLTLPAVLYSSGGDFQIPGFYPDVDGVAVPFASLLGGWQLGENRTILTPAYNVTGYGYPASGNRVIRSTQFEDGNETVGLLPAGPASGELVLFPPEWGLSSVGHLAVNPTKTEVVCFPVELAAEAPTSDKLLRVQIESATFGAECSVPYITVEPAPPVGEAPSVMLARN